VPGVCDDNKLAVALSAGTYTLLLTDANFIPLAVNLIVQEKAVLLARRGCDPTHGWPVWTQPRTTFTS